MRIMYWKPERGRAQSSWLRGCFRRLAVSREGRIRLGQRKEGLQVPNDCTVWSPVLLLFWNSDGFFFSSVYHLDWSPSSVTKVPLALLGKHMCRPCHWRDNVPPWHWPHLLSNTSPTPSLHFLIRIRISGLLFVRSVPWGKNMNTFKKSFFLNDYRWHWPL